MPLNRSVVRVAQCTIGGRRVLPLNLGSQICRESRSWIELGRTKNNEQAIGQCPWTSARTSARRQGVWPVCGDCTFAYYILFAILVICRESDAGIKVKETAKNDTRVVYWLTLTRIFLNRQLSMWLTSPAQMGSRLDTTVFTACMGKLVGRTALTLRSNAMSSEGNCLVRQS